MRTLYHYTCLAHVGSILRSGFIDVTESNVSAHRPHAGPDVVWLTTDADCVHGHGIDGNDVYAAGQLHAAGIGAAPELMQTWDKTRVRFTVRLPNDYVHKWTQWSQRFQMNPAWRSTLMRSANGGASTWRVVERRIPQDRWVEVIDRHTGERLWGPAVRESAEKLVAKPS